MKKIKTHIIIFIVIIAILLPVSAFASDIAIETDISRIAIGDTIVVTVTVRGESISIAKGFFDYEHTVLSYVKSTGGASDGNLNMVSLEKGGTATLTAVIEFEAIKEGTGDIEVSIDNIIDYSGSQLDACKGSINIEVFSYETEQEKIDNTEDALAEFELDGIIASNILGTDTQMYVWRSVKNLTLPSGFTDTQVIYNNEEISGAIDFKSTPTILLYLSDISGGNAAYYVFDEKNNSLQPYITVKSVSQTFAFLWPNESVTLPDGYVETTLIYNETEIPAWTDAEADGTVYLVYVKNESGENAIYQYVPSDKSMQRYIEQSPGDQTNNNQTNTFSDPIFITILIISGFLFITVIVLAILSIRLIKDKQALIIHSKRK